MDTAGIRKQLAHAIRKDTWFTDAWHFPGMARAAEIIEKGEIVISPQEPGVSTTEPQHPYAYWNQRIREEVVQQILSEAKQLNSELDMSFRRGMERAAELVSGE